jgi:hypothetical protein
MIDLERDLSSALTPLIQVDKLSTPFCEYTVHKNKYTGVTRCHAERQ